MFQSTDLGYRRSEAGFTLLEVLVALAVVATSIVAIASLVATNVRGTQALERRLALLETTRAVITGIPDHQRLAAGNLSGEIAEHRWRIDVLPFGAPFIDPRRSTPWVPQTVVVRVKSPTGRVLRIDTVRLRRGARQ